MYGQRLLRKSLNLFRRCPNIECERICTLRDEIAEAFLSVSTTSRYHFVASSQGAYANGLNGKGSEKSKRVLMHISFPKPEVQPVTTQTRTMVE
jgi:hypothetical protein